MTDEELKKVYRSSAAEAARQFGITAEQVNERLPELDAVGMRAVYNAALTRAAEIARGAQRIAHNESEVRGFEQATSFVAAAIDAEKGRGNA